ncbi:hypothetical protein LUZ61_017845 [Rhynchospora tenuis]|uniref:Uncharacterized protein n=1 Tax=Rhynchospora tenuis TaxID=198213 RepID=A0AAD6ELF7_9POAL|nr:hypothetical protein LUZ61_017845 [Rhynchospora tenuis]
MAQSVPTLTVSSRCSPGGPKHISRCQNAGPSKPFHARQTSLQSRRRLNNAFICASALGAKCAAEQTQTVTRQSSTITIAPIQGKEKSPDLDDGGSGFPPRDDDDGGGGGGGGGPNWSGGFFFFGFLAFLGLLRDNESDNSYSDDAPRGRY